MDSNDRIIKLEQEILILRKQLAEAEAKSKLISQENITIPWAGNLGIWSWNRTTGIVTFNPKKVEILGYDYTTFDPKLESFLALIHPDDYDETMENMKQHLIGNTPAYECEYRMRCSDGSYLWYYDRGVVTERDESGAPLVITGIVFDITEQKNFEAMLNESRSKLEESIAIRDRFFSIIAHDLRSPFSGLMGLSELTLMDFDDMSPEEIKNNLTLIHDSSKTIYRLIESLLQWAHIQQDNLIFSFKEIMIDKLIKQTIDLYSHIITTKKLTLSIKVESSHIIHADEKSIDTVLRNIISNAIRYCDDEGSLSITTEKV